MMSAERLALVVCSLCIAPVALAEDEEALPEAEFLEYLGMWEETDEDWLVLNEARIAEKDERSDPAPEGEESPEKTDES